MTQDPQDSSKSERIDVITYNDLYSSLLPSLQVDVAEWSVDVHRYYVDNLAPDIRTKMELNGYSDHKQTVSRSPVNQIQMIGRARFEASRAEKELSQQLDMISSQINGGHGFMALQGGNTQNNYQGGNTNPILLSPAEQAILRAKEGNTAKCWGCDGDHSWYDRVLKKVVCPNGNNPECIRKAANHHSEFLKKRKKINEKKQLDKALLKVSKSHYSDNTAVNSLIQQLLANSNDSSPTSSNKRQRMGNQTHNFFLGVLVLNAQAKQLPINIERDLPHIMLPIGPEDADINPTITGILDTGATLTAGYMPYILGICEKYPSLVQSIVWADKNTGYDPITLSGVVADDAKNMSDADKKRMSI